MKKKAPCLKGTTPDVKEDRQECVPPPLLALEELDDVLVAVLGSQVQRGLPVPVPRLQLHRALCIHAICQKIYTTRFLSQKFYALDFVTKGRSRYQIG